MTPGFFGHWNGLQQINVDIIYINIYNIYIYIDVKKTKTAEGKTKHLLIVKHY